MAKSRIVALVATISVALILPCGVCSCSGFSQSLNSKVEDEVAKDSGSDPVKVDFSKIVPGDWTRIVLICGAVSQERVNQVLGFGWELPNVENPGANAIMLFASSRQVEDRFVAGIDDQEEDHYFNPCFGTGIGKSAVKGPVSEIFLIPRSQSIVQLTPEKVESDFTMWYISEAERQRVARLS